MDLSEGTITTNRKMIDCIIFFNELELLSYRLHILKNVVDFFVIVESTHTFSGKEKNLFFHENKDKFADFADKIIHIVVDDLPHKYPNIDYKNFYSGEQWQNEIFQRNAISRGIEKLNLDDHDILIISDVDEIPNPATLYPIKHQEPPIEIHMLAMDFYYYNLNTKLYETWTEAKVLSYKKYQELAIPCDQIRHYQCPTIQNGGWHLSYFGDGVYIKTKIESFSHQEYNNHYYTDTAKIEEKIGKFSDLYDRNINFHKIPIHENTNLPPDYEKYLQKFIVI